MAICWSTTAIVGVSICSLIDIILLLSTLPIIYLFVKHCIKKKPPKTIFYATLIFLIVVIATLSLQLLLFVTHCTHAILSVLAEILFVTFYLTQTCLALFISFIKLYFVFSGTTLELSLITIRMYVPTNILLIILCILNGIVFGINHEIGQIFASFLFVILIILMIATLILFIRKIISVHKNMNWNQSQDKELINAVTKITILTIIPILTLILVISASFIVSGYIMNVLVLSDIYTKFCCIMMSYSLFHQYYNKLCRCLHNKCIIICSKMFARILEPQPKLEIAVNSFSVYDNETKI